MLILTAKLSYHNPYLVCGVDKNVTTFPSTASYLQVLSRKMSKWRKEGWRSLKSCHMCRSSRDDKAATSNANNSVDNFQLNAQKPPSLDPVCCLPSCILYLVSGICSVCPASLLNNRHNNLSTTAADVIKTFWRCRCWSPLAGAPKQANDNLPQFTLKPAAATGPPGCDKIIDGAKS